MDRLLIILINSCRKIALFTVVLVYVVSVRNVTPTLNKELMCLPAQHMDVFTHILFID